MELFTPIYESSAPGSAAPGVVECRVTGKITFTVASGIIITSGLYNYSLDMAVGNATDVVENFGYASEVSIPRSVAGTTFTTSYAFDAVFNRGRTARILSLRVFQDGSGPRDRNQGAIDMTVRHTPVAFTCHSIDLL